MHSKPQNIIKLLNDVEDELKLSDKIINKQIPKISQKILNIKYLEIIIKEAE